MNVRPLVKIMFAAAALVVGLIPGRLQIPGPKAPGAGRLPKWRGGNETRARRDHHGAAGRISAFLIAECGPR